MKFMSLPASHLRRYVAAFALALALKHSASAQSGLIGNTNNATTSDNIWSAGAYINAARFVAALKKLLENPEALFLDLR